jgi:hypothetical protein
MKYIKVDSYGACQRNKDGGSRHGTGGDPKLPLLRTYKVCARVCVLKESDDC